MGLCRKMSFGKSRKNKRAAVNDPALTGLSKWESVAKRLPQEEILAARPVGYDGMIHHFSAGTALPGFKSPHEVIEFLSVHAAFALRTSHGFPLLSIRIYCFAGEMQTPF
jgi:hypothetical protein